MKTAYFDCFSGVSGDMIIGALIDAGLDPAALRVELAKLPLAGYTISIDKTVKNGIAATRFNVITSAHGHERHLGDILALIDSSGLSGPVKKGAGEIFRRIAGVEAAIHNTSIEQVHFHEVGAVDSIIDIVGACSAFELLGITAVRASRINVGEGFVKTAHGLLPVPAPATAALLRNVPVYSSGVQAELATPTGAAVLTHFAAGFGPLPEMKISSVGYGAGMKDLPAPNLLRVFIGEMEREPVNEMIVSLETNIDDMNPEFYQHVAEELFTAGALDVYTTPVMMKKSRPGTLITVLARDESREALSAILFRETTTAGVRISRMERIALDREMRTVQTRYGDIPVKVLYRGGEIMTASPEYEECRRIAAERGVPLKRVYDEAKRQAETFNKK